MKSFLFMVLTIGFQSGIELEKRSLLNNRIEMLIPKHFKQMSAEMLDLKYPKSSSRPTFVLTNETGGVNVGLNHMSNPANPTLIESYKNMVKAQFEKAFPTAIWKGDGVRTINGKQVGYVKFIADAIDQKVYNYIFLTDLDDKLLCGTFNCVERLLPEWEKASEEIVNSLRVK
jgi:hypothetical protein